MKRAKLLVAIILCSCMLFTNYATAAGVRDDWDIHYIPNAPGGVSVQYNWLFLEYYSGGYYEYCESISGSVNRYLTINSTSAGGMTEMIVTTTGRSTAWKMKISTSTQVRFEVKGVSSGSVYSEGYIHIN